jgi:hypothetical protein
MLVTEFVFNVSLQLLLQASFAVSKLTLEIRSETHAVYCYCCPGY